MNIIICKLRYMEHVGIPVKTRRCASKDAGPRRGEEDNPPFIRVWKPSPSRRVLKPWERTISATGGSRPLESDSDCYELREWPLSLWFPLWREDIVTLIRFNSKSETIYDDVTDEFVAFMSKFDQSFHFFSQDWSLN